MENDQMPGQAGVDEAEAHRDRMLRKRTKTGCLTCRKRRIKCGEERPTCKNCIKSRRHCDGYNNHRLVFKPTTIDFRHLQNGAATITFPAATMGLDINLGVGYPYQIDPYQFTGPARPRPLLPITPSEGYPYSVPFTAPPLQDSWHGVNPFQDPNVHKYTHPHANLMMQQHQHQQPPLPHPAMSQPTQQDYNQQSHPSHHPYEPQQTSFGHRGHQFPAAPAGTMHPPDPVYSHDHDTNTIHMPNNSAVEPHGVWHHHQHHDDARHPSMATSGSMPSLSMSSIDSAPNGHNVRLPRQPQTPQTAPLLNNPWTSGQLASHLTGSVAHKFATVDDKTSSSPRSATAMDPAVLLDHAAVEYHDDDYYDVTPQEESNLFFPSSPGPVSREALAVDHVVKLGDLRISHGLRSNYGYSEGLLDNYRPELTANPLKNPATARVFAHFIQVTGTSICMQSRRTLPPGAQKSRQDIPFSEAGIWTHVMPMAALHDQGLLQAMLALSSLHIAKLTGGSTTPSYKHYAYALKAVHHSVGHATKRNSVPTLAASILLAVYELWCAEHVKWSSHLAGAGQLLVETDFAGMHKKSRQLKVEKDVEKGRGYPSFRRVKAQGDFPPQLRTKAKQFKDLEQVPHIDPQVVSLISGRVVNYDQYGQVLGDETTQKDKHANLDVPIFESLKDLFWGFAKHDMIGSVISGNPLFLSFSRWTDCPPRAPINAGPGISYGAYDHLMLICGRIADFIVRDRKRKLKAMQLNGGTWKPPQGMQLGPPGAGPPSAGTPRGPPSNGSAQPSPRPPGNTPSPQLPPYFGMAPPGPAATMPSSYWAESNAPQVMSPEQEEFIDFSTQTTQAIQEWDEILLALDTLVSMLGEYYQPLGPEYHSTALSPWGPAIIYRALDVGSLWGFINFAYILAHRSHPHMPPYAHMAAAIAARTTKPYAEEIGRIAAGIMPPDNGKPITPYMGAAMCDLCLPLFFSAVQLHGPHERDWIITALFDIERRCAYDTAGTIAHGCQTAWHKAGQAGRGPPYVHRYNTRAQDERVNGSWEKLDPNAELDQDDVTDRRFIQTKPTARLHWAMGVLESEEDGQA